MHASIIAILAAAGLSSLVAAAPLESRQECAAYPWFIVPHDSRDCTGDAAVYQPNSGPISANPQNVTCGSLYNPAGEPANFGSVAVNRDPCPGQAWTINLYTDELCATEPTVINSDICVPSLTEFAAGRWARFDAVLYPQ